jgi:DNA-binding response OmpR family regulator
MKLLLVEDDQQLGDALRTILAAHAYSVTWVRTAEDAQRFIQSESFDLLLFDIVLPNMSGLELLNWARRRGCDAPIMMLTARDSVVDRVLGLDGGADDYLPKPFAMEEFLSRCRVLLRRNGQQRAAVWTIGRLCINTANRQVTVSGLQVSLSPREFDLLLRLAMSPGQVMTRSQLARGSNAEDTIESNAVDVHIYSLRKKLGGQMIGTVRGVGYILEEA